MPRPELAAEREVDDRGAQQERGDQTDDQSGTHPDGYPCPAPPQTPVRVTVGG